MEWGAGATPLSAEFWSVRVGLMKFLEFFSFQLLNLVLHSLPRHFCQDICVKFNNFVSLSWFGPWLHHQMSEEIEIVLLFVCEQ